MSVDPAALFAQHRTAVLAAGAAGVAGLALLRKRKATATPSGTPGPAGTIPAAAVVPASSVQGTFPDTSTSDVYNAVMDTLLKQQSALTPPPVAVAPKPIASTLFAPTGSGNYVRYQDGTIGEVESDGSIYGIAPGEDWHYSGTVTYNQLPADYYKTNPYATKVENLANAGKPAGGTAGK